MTELMDLVIDCENQLGWCPPHGMPTWQGRAREIGKLRNAMREHPGVTIQDLRLALAYCRRRREAIDSTLQLIGKVSTAKAHAVVAERTSDLTEQHRAAIAWEQWRGDTQSEKWIGRLVRSVGPLRADTLIEWRAAGRG